jgi:enoyl-CoA hydratase
MTGGAPLVEVSVDPATRVCRIRLDRPEARNAQSTALLYELNRAFDRAARDPEVSVIVLSGNGPHFSAGHDLREQVSGDPAEPVGTWAGFDDGGCEGRLSAEHELYLDLCRRWRDIPKPTIAQVHGQVIAAGMMLAWVCDLIVAAEGTTFSDPVVRFGMPGVEYFAHPQEFGARRAKYLLYTSSKLDAREALSIGMVAEVVAADQLEERVDALATEIAKQPLMALKLAKQSINAAVDAAGARDAMDQAFALHQLGHAHNQILFGYPMDPTNLPS